LIAQHNIYFHTPRREKIWRKLRQESWSTLLLNWGVEVVFGLPGDGINDVMEALRRRQGKIRFVQVRHEEAAAFMACGFAKYTGRLGVCLPTDKIKESI